MTHVRGHCREKRWECFLLLTFSVLQSADLWGGQTQAPVRDHGSISIILPDTREPAIDFASKELEHYLQRMTGQAVAIGTKTAPHRIFLGQIPQSLSHTAAGKLQRDREQLRPDGFLIRRLGPDLVILGSNGRGTLYGTYAFLENLGVRWFFPGPQNEIVPRRPLDWSGPLEIMESPAFRERILFYWPNNYTRVEDWIDFCAKMRLNRIAFHYTWPAINWYVVLRDRLRAEIEKRGLEVEVGGHFLSALMPRSHFKEHPEWFRMNEKGERVNDFNLNPFNSDALDYVASEVSKYLRQMPEASLYHVWADDIDGGGWSHEPGKEQYTPSDQALLVSNHIVRRLRQNLPNANLVFLAYHDTVYPPRIVKPEAGIVYLYAPRERCYGHALNDPRCSLNLKYSRALEEALPVFGSGSAEVFEYYDDLILYENFPNPPMPEVLKADAQYYHRLGIPAVGPLMTNTSEFITPMVNAFLSAQALWDPTRDLGKSLEDYSSIYFNDKGLAAYFRELEEGTSSVLSICEYQHPGSAWDNLRVERETDEALHSHVLGIEAALRGPLPRAKALLEAALKAAKRNRTHRERLIKEKDGLEFTMVQSKLYYHVLKGEWLYRMWSRMGDPEAGLGAAAEAALARLTWEKQERLVGQRPWRGSPIIPDPRSLEERIEVLRRKGYSSDPLAQQLLDGMGGVVVSGPSGSKAVLWTDAASSRHVFAKSIPGVQWLDEFGQPASGTIDLLAAPAVAGGKQLAGDQLFSRLLQSQLTD